MQLGAEPTEFFLVGICHLIQQFDTARGESDIHLATIFVTGDADDQFLRPKPIDQPDGTMVGNLQLFCQFADGGGIPTWKAFDGEESLVLPRS